MFGFMRELFILIAHLLVTLAKLGTRGGLERHAGRYRENNPERQIPVEKGQPPQCRRVRKR